MTKKESKFNKEEYIYMLSTLVENRRKYAGIVKYDAKDNRFIFFRGKNGTLDQSDIRIKSLLYVINHLLRKDTSIDVKIFHVGRCGRCRRKLTTPESVLTGLGPECSKIEGVERVKV